MHPFVVTDAPDPTFGRTPAGIVFEGGHKQRLPGPSAPDVLPQPWQRPWSPQRRSAPDPQSPPTTDERNHAPELPPQAPLPQRMSATTAAGTSVARILCLKRTRYVAAFLRRAKSPLHRA